MKPAEYTRTAHTVRDEATGRRQVFKSINQAKRWSREYQQAHGGLGIGIVRVEY